MRAASTKPEPSRRDRMTIRIPSDRPHGDRARCARRAGGGPGRSPPCASPTSSGGVPAARDAFDNPIGFSTWQDGGGALALSAVAVEPGDALALPDQEAVEHVLRVDHRIASWGGFTQAFADDGMTRWIPVDLSGYVGLRFWYAGDGRGGTVQVDLFDNRNPSPHRRQRGALVLPLRRRHHRVAADRDPLLVVRAAHATSSPAARPTTASAWTRPPAGRSASRPARGRPTWPGSRRTATPASSPRAWWRSSSPTR
jgi:hypothetical protein